MPRHGRAVCRYFYKAKVLPGLISTSARARLGCNPLSPRVQDGSGSTAIAARLHAMAVHSQQDTAALPASRPFAVAQAGYDYFADEQHFRSLADRVLDGLRQGGRIVLVTEVAAPSSFADCTA
jgi:hypothetical protein